MWKTSTVIPAPQNSKPTPLNEFRPTAITFLAMKCLEKILKPEVFKEPEQLGTTIDSKLKVITNCDIIFRKCQQRLQFSVNLIQFKNFIVHKTLHEMETLLSAHML